jgi:precorrin-4/cobalt-precorrin-4 C11-methyltransferase
MTVHFIGAGPGAADLITVRGRDLMGRCPVCLYAGSLIPRELLAHCLPGARIVNTAAMDLDAIMAEISAAHVRGQDVARLHSGDLSVWSAMGEQLRRLRAAGIDYTVTPGVPSFAAAAAALGAELTLPGLCQSVVLTRTSGRATAMPEGENLAAFAATGAVLAIHLSIHMADKVQAELLPHYGADGPAAIVWRASWPDETVVRTTVGGLAQAVAASMERTALILVGRSLQAEAFAESRLYASDYDRRYRPLGTAPRFPAPEVPAGAALDTARDQPLDQASKA